MDAASGLRVVAIAVGRHYLCGIESVRDFTLPFCCHQGPTQLAAALYKPLEPMGPQKQSGIVSGCGSLTDKSVIDTPAGCQVTAAHCTAGLREFALCSLGLFDV